MSKIKVSAKKICFNRKNLFVSVFCFLISFITGCAIRQFPVVQPVVDIAREESARMKAQIYFIDARDYERRGLDQAAEKYYELAYSLDPTSKVLREQVVQKYVESGKFSQALLLIRGNRKNEELDEEEKKIVSTIYLKMGEFRKAAVVLESIDNKSDEEVYSLGLIYESIKDFKKALLCYGDFYKRKPEAIQIGFKIGKILLSEKRYDEAKNLYLEMKKQDSENPDIYSSLGAAMLLSEDTVSGMEYFDSALVLDSLHEESLRSKAQVFIARNEFTKAIACYEKMYTGSLYGEVYGRTLALLYYYDKQFDKAGALLRELLLEFMDDYELHFYMGLVYSATDQNDQARIELEKSLTLQNDYIDAWKELCYISVREKNYEEAMAVAERFLKDFPQSAEAWRLKGFIFNLNGLYKDAVEMLENAVKFDSKSPKLWYEYGSSLERNKEFDKAVN
ncbi:MAG: tetratricopeptide repeat protein, partial [Fibrobacter sp.]|nr:tetratricopeptide repeat protein [Fibrobacter sp.]